VPGEARTSDPSATFRGAVPPIYRTLTKDTLVYVSADVAIKSVSFLITPILTRFFPPTGFAVIDVLVTVQAAVTILGGLNLESALARYYYEYKGDERNRLISTLLVTMCVTTLGVGLIVATLAGPLSEALFESIAYREAVALAAFVVFPTLLSSLGLAIYRFDRRSFEYVLVSVFGTLLLLGLTVFAVTRFHGSVTAVIAAQLCAQGSIATIVIVRNRRYFAPVFDRRLLARCLRFSLPQVPAVAISWYLASSNRFFLIALSSLAAVASFAAASKLSLVVMAAVSSFLLAWRPVAMSLIRDAQAGRVYANVMYATVAALSVVTIMVALVARPFLYYYAGPAYAAASTAASILVLATCIGTGFGMFFALGLEIAERTERISMAQVVTFAVNTILNVALIPWWGFEGAAVALLGGAIAQALALQMLSRRHRAFSYNPMIWLAPAAAAAVIGAVRMFGIG
jgi:O-antigen/teichoic acid export membrane protein